jgi:DNA-binding MarR family transcriptional regulator
MAKRGNARQTSKFPEDNVPNSRRALSFPSSEHERGRDVLLSWLFQISIRLQSSLDSRFLRFGMTVQEASILLRCVELRSTTAGRLAVVLERDKGAMTRHLNRLLKSNLIVREVNQDDRRSSILRPTAEGNRVARDLLIVFGGIRKELYAGIGKDDVDLVIRTLTKVHRNAADMSRNKM